MLKKILATLICTVVLCVLLPILGSSLNDTSTGEPQVGGDENNIVQNDPPPTDPVDPPVTDPIIFDRPEEMKAVRLDLNAVLNSDDEESVKKAIDAFLKEMTDMEMNTVITDLTYLSGSIYSCRDIPNALSFDLLQYLIESCDAKELYLYADLDICTQKIEDGLTYKAPTSSSDLTYAINRLSELAHNYTLDGIFISGYQSALNEVTYADYREFGGGIGFENWVRKMVDAAVLKTAQYCKTNYPETQLGILVDAVWKNKSSDESGTAVSGVQGAFAEKFADTKTYVKSGLFDFVMVDIPYSTIRKEGSFNDMISWWKSLISTDENLADTPIYAILHNEKLAGKESGWTSPDQIIKQVMALRELELGGCVFNSYPALKENVQRSTTTLLSYYKNVLNNNLLLKELVINNPSSSKSVTYEKTFNIYGGGDPNFPFVYNGKEVKLSDKGVFNVTVNLKVGDNVFEFEHKGKTLTYTITRKVKVLQSASPTGSMTALSGTSVPVTVKAYAGSTVRATLNGKTITLKETTIAEDGSASDSYRIYTGSFTLPTVTSNKNIGSIKVTASWSGYSESKTGATVTVKPKEVVTPPVVVPPKDDTPSTPSSGTSSGSNSSGGTSSGGTSSGGTSSGGTSSGGTSSGSTSSGGTSSGGTSSGGASSGNTSSDPKPTVGTVTGNKCVIIAGDGEGEGYNPNTLTNYSDPDFYGLGKGAIDFIVSEKITCTDAGYTDEYYLLGSGIRIEAADIRVDGNITLSANVVNSVVLASSGNNFNVTIKQSWAAPYRISVDNGKVIIRLYYKTADKPTLSLPAGSPFSKAQWEIVDGVDAIVLYGNVKGVSSSYSGNNIVISLKKPVSSLSGVVVYLDPGHGGYKTSTSYDPGAVVGNKQEASINLQVAQAAQSALQNMGATVIMGTRPYDLAARYQEAAKYNADIFVSIHQNISVSNASGTEVYYFNNFSSKLASSLSSQVSSSLGIKDRGGKFGYYGVTRHTKFPAVLIECGYMSNSEELEKLIDPAYQAKMGQALADGIAASLK